MGTKRKNLKFAIGVAIILSMLGWLGYSGIQESKTYYVTIAELLASPDAQQRRYRVGGDVAPGSIQRAQGRVQFLLEAEGKVLPVVYVGTSALPDTFQDGAEALADGRYQQDGTFQAEAIQAKCASKYEPAEISAEQGTSPSTSY